MQRNNLTDNLFFLSEKINFPMHPDNKIYRLAINNLCLKMLYGYDLYRLASLVYTKISMKLLNIFKVIFIPYLSYG